MVRRDRRAANLSLFLRVYLLVRWTRAKKKNASPEVDLLDSDEISLEAALLSFNQPLFSLRERQKASERELDLVNRA